MRAVFVVVFTLVSRLASAEIVDGKRLEQALIQLPDTKLTSDLASQLVTLSRDLASTDLDPFVLLAQLYVESRFDSTATSRSIHGKRSTGAWTSREAPKGWTGTLYCGMSQTVAVTWAGCLKLREPKIAIEAQVAELREWMQVTHGNLTRSLASFGCGNFGARTGRCNGYPQRIQAIARRLRRASVVVPMS